MGGCIRLGTRGIGSRGQRRAHFRRPNTPLLRRSDTLRFYFGLCGTRGKDREGDAFVFTVRFRTTGDRTLRLLATRFRRRIRRTMGNLVASGTPNYGRSGFNASRWPSVGHTRAFRLKADFFSHNGQTLFAVKRLRRVGLKFCRSITITAGTNGRICHGRK